MGSEAKKRNNSLDLLRILSTISVMIIHINAHFFEPLSELPPSLHNMNYVIESILNIITRFSVPAFVMISGAFILNNPKNRDFRFFYKKVLSKTFLPVIIVAALLFVFDEVRNILLHRSLLSPIKGILIGKFYHLWFMYMLFGLYVLAPCIIRVKEKLEPKHFKAISIILCVWAVISQATSSQKLAYSIGVIVAYLSYFTLGNVLMCEENARPASNKPLKVFLCFLLATVMFGITFFVRYKGFTYYIFDSYTNFFSPTIMIASIAIYKAFLMINIKKNLSGISFYTFYIYIFHGIVYKTLFSIADGVLPENEVACIAVVTVCTFIIAYILAYVFNLVFHFVKKIVVKPPA